MARKVTVLLPEEVIAEWEKLAAARNRSMPDALADALHLSKFLTDQQAARKRLVLERPDGRFERVIFGE